MVEYASKGVGVVTCLNTKCLVYDKVSHIWSEKLINKSKYKTAIVFWLQSPNLASLSNCLEQRHAICFCSVD